jgi:hypothetical protein
MFQLVLRSVLVSTVLKDEDSLARHCRPFLFQKVLRQETAQAACGEPAQVDASLETRL